MTKRVQRRRGTSAGHVSFTGAQAEITVDTDKGWLRVHDGATPGGSVINPEFNISRFGARPGIANNAPFIQDCIDTAHDAATGVYDQGGATVLIPPGIFPVEEELIPREKVDYEGVHPRASIIKAVGAIWAFQRLESSAIRLLSGFRDLGIWGDGDTAGVSEDGEALGGLNLEQCHYLGLDNVEFRNFSAEGGLGLSLGRVHFWKVSRSTFEFIHTNCIKLYAVSGVGSNGGEISGQCEMIANNMPECVALAAATVQNLAVKDTDFEGSTNGLRAMELTGCEGVYVRGNYIELWAGAALDLTAGSNQRVTIEHNVINGAIDTDYIIDLNTAGTPNKRVTIRHNRFPDAGALKTCVRVGNATRVLTYDNDPDASIMLDQRSGSFDNTLVGALVGTATWDPALIVAGAFAEVTVSVPGARRGDPAVVSYSLTIGDTIYLEAQVQADDTVRVILRNDSAASFDGGSGTLKVIVFKQGI